MANTPRKRGKAKKAEIDENPEWSLRDFKKAKLAIKVVPDAVKAIARGRPRLLNAKVRVSLRIDPEVVEGYKNLGPKWQARMNEILRLALLTRGYGRRRSPVLSGKQKKDQAS